MFVATLVAINAANENSLQDLRYKLICRFSLTPSKSLLRVRYASILSLVSREQRLRHNFDTVKIRGERQDLFSNFAFVGAAGG